MAYLSYVHPFTLPRSRLNCPISFSLNPTYLEGFLSRKKWACTTFSRKGSSKSVIQNKSNEENISIGKTVKTAGRLSRKKEAYDGSEESTGSEDISAKQEEGAISVISGEISSVIPKRGRKKSLSSLDGTNVEKKVSPRRRKKKTDSEEDQNSEDEVNRRDEFNSSGDIQQGNNDLLLGEGEDISFTYSWPPLVCCFGAAQHAFLPSGRPSNRLIDHEIHDSMKDMFWSPTKFVRAPGGSPCNVAIALARLGGRVVFMGKVGNDDYGQGLLYYMNVNKVQTRAIKVDDSKSTAMSHMKIAKRGGLRMNSVKPCAEDCLSSSEINVDVLKEAKMFYFNSLSLLDRNMQTTTINAIKIAKNLGEVIFFDLNLPLPLWQSSEETKDFIQEAWNLSDIIEVTKQELEFLCKIKPMEAFDTKDNHRSKFVHHEPNIIKSLWHKELKVLFVTNGTSKIHYYTEEDNGWVHGMEDPPITPFTSDMSVAGDAIVAALMRMLTVQPHLATNKAYLEHMIKDAIDCGVIDQWLHAQTYGFPPKEDTEEPVPDPNGIKSITEKEYRTLKMVS